MIYFLAEIITKLCISQFHLCPGPPPGNCGAFARLVGPGGGAFANFALPGGRAFVNPRAIPELLTRTRFPISEYNYKEGFNGKNADWFICQ